MIDTIPELQTLRSLGELARSTPPTLGVLYRHYDHDGTLLYVGSSDAL